jgi:hypothetical protein
MDYFLGVDPGSNGACAVIDAESAFMWGARWSLNTPSMIVSALKGSADRIKGALIEKVSLFPQKGMGHSVAMQSLLVNAGIWEGWLLAFDIPYKLITPPEWQGMVGLQKWKKHEKRLELKGASAMGLIPNTPLRLARKLWPQAPLDHAADDGTAVALILAECARQQALNPIYQQTQATLFTLPPGRKRRRPRAKAG